MQSSSSAPESSEVRAIAFRNRLIADPRFRRWLGWLPFTRRFLRGRVAAMFDINAGFVYSQIALAMVETRMFDALAAGPLSIADAARHADLPEAGAERLLKAAAALQLAQALKDGRYMLGERGAALHADPGIAAMIVHHKHLYADLADPVALLRRGGGGGALQHYWSYARADDPAASGADSVAPYSALMAASQAMVAEQVVTAHRFGKHRRMLDVGGGDGVFARAVKTRWPMLDVAVFDLPAVAARATGVESHGGNFFESPCPTGFDLVTLIRVLHDHDDTPTLKLLHNIAAALKPGDSLLIAEPMAQTHAAEPMGDGYFGLYLWAMGAGRPRARAEITAMLHAAGFADVQEIRTSVPLIARVLIASRR
ncbi:MAG: methyltransferase [Sphingomonadaceae bacterium]